MRWSFCLRLFRPQSAGDRVARQDERLEVGGWLSETIRYYANHSRSCRLYQENLGIVVNG
jgi:hypothetical protein